MRAEIFTILFTLVVSAWGLVIRPDYADETAPAHGTLEKRAVFDYQCPGASFKENYVMNSLTNSCESYKNKKRPHGSFPKPVQLYPLLDRSRQHFSFPLFSRGQFYLPESAPLPQSREPSNYFLVMDQSCRLTAVVMMEDGRTQALQGRLPSYKVCQRIRAMG
ncbi:hypothetical protein K3495_g4953 [Podosphaera aphanis]|nr:hypothetical protein K3495_g4953 [Podosphaera aphanis]